jgi:ribosome biogenesis GTPase
VFSDVSELGATCKFGDCSHKVEPGCAVRAAIEAGQLDAFRLERYLRLRDELDEQAEMVEQRRRKAQRGSRGRRRR